MPNGTFHVPEPFNEPELDYAPGSPERRELKAKLKEMRSSRPDIPLVIGGREVRTGRTVDIRAPHDHQLALGRFHQASAEEVQQAIGAALKARRDWAAMDWQERAGIFLRAADLAATRWRQALNASTMLGQSKNVRQAEIDAACEVADFWRYNPFHAQQLYAQHPAPSPHRWNRLELRPLEGFVFAVTPFNFTSIAANLPTAPALMGNTVVWKPASTSVLSSWYLLKLLEEAGLPPGVVNFVPGSGRAVGDPALASPHLAGLHFTGGTDTFNGMWEAIGSEVGRYRSYPRVVGETGGKGFAFVHASADVEVVVTALVRGAFEYQGQKCSATSRAYVPESLWPAIKERLLPQVAELAVGDPEDFTTFMGAVIDRPSWERIRGYVEHARQSADARILVGGRCDDRDGFFVSPTVVQATDPHFKLMEEEIFGPVLTVHVYPDADFGKTLEACDRTSPYALTGSVFATDREAARLAGEVLRDAAGNFYVNDKTTGAVVGQQPFGGARASGTNDKAGSPLNLQRWVSMRTLSESYAPPRETGYPHMAER